MVSVLARYWNEIAETQKLKTAWAKRMFTLDQDQINDEIDKEYFQLKAVGLSEPVASAYLSVKALLLENEAISHWVMATERDDLRMALPETCTVDEAVMIADMDRNGTLTELQQKQLAGLLNASLPGTRSKDFIVSVSRKEIDSALSFIKKSHKGKKPFTLDLVFKKSSLLLDAMSASVEIPLTAFVGRPRSTVSLAGQVITGLLGTFPTTDTLHLSMTGGKFKIERLSLPCQVTA